MGSRAVVVLCKDQQAALDRFGIEDGGTGVIYTRTGRRFHPDIQIERELIDRLREACNRSGFWEEFSTDWVCLDCELMPWSAKALELLKTQYAAVGAAGRMNLDPVLGSLAQARSRIRESAKIHRSICGCISALLLAGRVVGRLETSTVSSAGYRGSSAYGQGPLLAHG